ncbi:hypothetical protein ACFWBS_35600 [Streptomyces mirabilis]|uniref:hypothetical protein n=1 Tax=Streptomyces TaxID=1883 RepID=UPI001180F0EC|nr:hypothetical protein [Streptomyces sp. OK228]
MAKDWAPAVQDGLAAVGAPGLLADDDVTVAFYGDLFLPPEQQLSGGEEYLTATDVESGWE